MNNKLLKILDFDKVSVCGNCGDVRECFERYKNVCDKTNQQIKLLGYEKFLETIKESDSDIDNEYKLKKKCLYGDSNGGPIYRIDISKLNNLYQIVDYYEYIDAAVKKKRKNGMWGIRVYVVFDINDGCNLLKISVRNTNYDKIEII